MEQTNSIAENSARNNLNVTHYGVVYTAAISFYVIDKHWRKRAADLNNILSELERFTLVRACIVLLLLSTCLFYTPSVTAEVHVYRNQYGQLLFSDDKIQRAGYTYVRTLGSLAFAPPSMLQRMERSGSSKKKMNTSRYDHYIYQSAQAHEVDPALVKAVIHAESAFNRRAESHVGAQGLMQLMPATAASYHVTDSFNPRQNIEAGTKHLKYLMGLFKNNIDYVLAAYNAGQGNVWKYNGIPPFKETQNYVVKVKKLRSKYRQ